MSNAIFPQLPGLKLELSKTPTWSTKTVQSVGGREVRAGFFSYPTIKYELTYEILRTYTAVSELHTIMGFFNSRRGRFDSFLFDDKTDNTAVDQAFGIVVAGSYSYQLMRVQGGSAAPVGAINSTPVLKANGVTISAATYSIDDNAVVTFSTLPTVGASLTWSGTYYARVVFLQDALEFDRFTHQLWAAKKIQFQTDRVV